MRQLRDALWHVSDWLCARPRWFTLGDWLGEAGWQLGDMGWKMIPHRRVPVKNRAGVWRCRRCGRLTGPPFPGGKMDWC